MPRSSKKANTVARAGRTRQREPRPLPSETLRFRMPSARTSVAPTVERIVAALGRVGLGDDQRADLSVALAEALSNAAVHGNHLKPRSWVTITLKITPRKQVTIDIKDSGKGFDAASLSDPTEAPHLLLPRGRGVFLMRSLVDHLEYTAPGNRVRLVMRARPLRSNQAAS